MLINSKLPIEVLGKIWELSDIDKDGFLDKDEFYVVSAVVIWMTIFTTWRIFLKKTIAQNLIHKL